MMERRAAWAAAGLLAAGAAALAFELHQAAVRVIGHETAVQSGAQGADPADDSLWAPSDVATDGTRLVVADENNYRVLIWNALPVADGQAADLVLGQPDFASRDARPVSAAAFRPGGVATDGTRLAVADTPNHRVLIWTSFPTANFQAADLVLGQADFASAIENSGGVSARSLSSPTKLEIAGARLFVVDAGNNRVAVHSPFPTASNAAASAILGQPTPASRTPNTGGVSGAALNEPTGVGSDGTRVYVSDFRNHRVLVWLTMPAATGTAADLALGQPDLASNADPGLLGPATTRFPRDVTTDGTRVLVSEGERVSLWANPPAVSNVGADIAFGAADLVSTPDAGPSATDVNEATGLSIAAGRIAFADAGYHRAALFLAIPAAHNPPADRIAGQPDATHAGPNRGDPNPSGLFLPSAVASDWTRLLVVDGGNHRVLLWNALPAANRPSADLALGQPDLASGGADNPAISASSLDDPADASIEGGRVAVADRGNHRVLLWDAVPAASGQAADRVLGQPDFVSVTVNNGGLGASSLFSPSAVLVWSGRLLVADRDNARVLIWLAWPSADFQPADRVLGQATPASAGNPDAATRISDPADLATDGTRLYVADPTRNRVLVWDAFPTTDNQRADRIFGQSTFAGASADADGISWASLDGPAGVAAAGGWTALADADNSRVLLFLDPLGERPRAAAVLGQPDFLSSTGNNGGISAASLGTPGQPCLLADRLYVPDVLANRVLEYPVLPTAAAPTAVAPANGSTVTSTVPTLRGSAFSHPTAGRTHAASHWEIRNAGDDWGTLVFDSGVDATNLATLAVPAGTLVASGSYVWRVRHADATATWGPWSAESAFSVNPGVAPPEPTLSMADRTSGSASRTDSRVVDVSIGNDATAAAWLLEEGSAAQPDTADPRWGAEPATFLLSPGEGAKTVYVWVRTAGGFINVGATSAGILYDVGAPGIGGGGSGGSGGGGCYAARAGFTEFGMIGFALSVLLAAVGSARPRFLQTQCESKASK